MHFLSYLCKLLNTTHKNGILQRPIYTSLGDAVDRTADIGGLPGTMGRRTPANQEILTRHHMDIIRGNHILITRHKHRSTSEPLCEELWFDTIRLFHWFASGSILLALRQERTAAQPLGRGHRADGMRHNHRSALPDRHRHEHYGRYHVGCGDEHPFVGCRTADSRRPHGQRVARHSHGLCPSLPAEYRGTDTIVRTDTSVLPREPAEGRRDAAKRT